MGKSKPKILYLTRSYKFYSSASYQSEFIYYFEKHFDVDIFIVPTLFKKNLFEDYFDKKKDLIFKEAEDKLKKIYINYDLLVFGHNWIGDAPYPEAIYPYGFEFLKDIKIRKIAILNKEYSRFKDKINYFRAFECNELITHHSNIEKKFKVELIENTFSTTFVPFAVDSKKWFNNSNISKHKNYNLFFSGHMLNPTWGSNEHLVRGHVEDFIFYKFLGVRLKSKFKKIYWNAKSTNFLINKLNRYSHLSNEDYVRKMSEALVVFNTISFELISPRTFESLSIGAVPLLVEDSEYSKVNFLSEFCIFFKSDLSNFYQNWQKSIELGSNPKYSNKIIENAYENHTWSSRMKLLENLFN